MGLLSKIKQWLSKCRKQAHEIHSGEVDASGRCIRIPSGVAACALHLGGDKGRTLHLYPSFLLNPSSLQPVSYLLVDKDAFFQGVSFFMQLAPGDKLVLGRHDAQQSNGFSYPQQVASRHAILEHQGSHLYFQDLKTDHGSRLQVWKHEEEVQRLTSWRYEQLARIQKLYGGPLQPLDAEQALVRLTRAHVLQKGYFKPPKWLEQDQEEENCPAILHLAEQATPILVGDLHANLDHLLTLLTTGGVLNALAKDQATLIFLGDAVHPDRGENLQDMTGSMLIMDLIFSLMIRFPGRIVYLRGNHDGFDEEIYKGGISQGLAWQDALLQARGAGYLAALQAWYNDLPYIVTHAQVVACHASPFVIKVDRQVLSRLRSYPGLLRQLIWNRIRTNHRPGGYTNKDVQRFRQVLRLSSLTPLVVGHSPMDGEHTCWLHAGGIENHHVLYGGHPQRMGWLTWHGEEMFLQEYGVEALSSLPTRLESPGGEQGEAFV